MSMPEKHLLLPPHLSDAHLVAFCDGELDRAQAAAAKTHVESCWSCRSRMREVQSSIENFLQARAVLAPADSAFSESRVEQFRQRLSRHAAAQGQLAFGERLADWRSRLGGFLAPMGQYRQAVIASVVTICLVVVMFTDVLNTRVSADTVLSRAEEYETTHRPTPGFVTRTSIRVDRIGRGDHSSHRLGTITLLRDSATASTYIKTEASSGKMEAATVASTRQVSPTMLNAVLSDSDEDISLAAYLTQRQWFPDLSVSEFRRLADWRGNTDLSAQREGGSFQLRCPFAADNAAGIVETELRVDSAEFAPSSLSIFTAENGGGNEYRFTRTEFASEWRSPEIAEVFQHSEKIRVGATTLSLPGISRPDPLSYASSHASENEVSVAAALHGIDACLGEEIYIFPMSDGSLLVQGLVDTPSRRQNIRDTLKMMSGAIRVEVYIPRELRSGSSLFPSPYQLASGALPGQNSAATLADLSGSNVPLHDLLYQHFYKQGSSPEDTNKQVALFSDEVVSLARQTFLHAWALKKLDQEFGAKRVEGLSANALQQISRMREDHVRWISNIASREREMLAPVAGPEVMAGVSEIEAAKDSDTLLRLAQEQNDLVRTLFTASSQAPASPDAFSRLMSVLKSMGS